MSSGCYRRITYESPAGRRVEIVNIGFDSDIGSLRAETTDGRIEIDNASSRAAVAGRLIDAAADLARGGRP